MGAAMFSFNVAINDYILMMSCAVGKDNTPFDIWTFDMGKHRNLL